MSTNNLFYKLAGKLLKTFSPFLSDTIYIRLMYKLQTGKKLNLKNPQTFSEKIQYLKLYNHNPLYTIMVDKIKVKEFVAKKIGDKYIIPTLKIWTNAHDINFNELPDRFVIKCNHNSGKGMFICKNKSNINEKKIKAELQKGLHENYYMRGREWPYKNVPRRIIVEKYMEDNEIIDNQNKNKVSSIGNLRDYKIYCFNGEPKLCQVISNRAIDEKIDFYNMNWERIHGLTGLTKGVSNSNNEIPCPKSFPEMVTNAKILSKDIPFSRIDFYDINGHAYFGEITFFPASGFGSFHPDKWNYIIGSWIKLPKESNN